MDMYPGKMKTRPCTETEWQLLRGTCDFQFGRAAHQHVFLDPGALRIQHSPKTGKVRYIFEGRLYLATLRAVQGTLALSINGAERLWRGTAPLQNRVVVLNDVASYIARGKNTFAKHVVDAWEDLRPMDDVLLTDETDRFLAIGRAVLNRKEMLDFDYGVAVQTRTGIEKKK